MKSKIYKFIRRLMVGIAGCVCFFSCSFIEDIFNKDDELSDKEFTRIHADYETIDLMARDAVLKDEIDINEISALIDGYLQLESFEDAWLDVDGIVVKFKKYGLALWSYKHEFIDPAFFGY
jgi:hypothetical protein